MSVFDWESGFVLVATQLLPGVVAVVLALAAAVAARSKAMPALIGASGLAAALSLLGVLMQLQHFASRGQCFSWYDTIDVYVACAVALIVLTFGLKSGRSRTRFSKPGLGSSLFKLIDPS